VAGGEFPIGAWWPPPPEETTSQRYQEIANANFNFVIGGNGVTNQASTTAALGFAEENGLKFLITDDPGQNDSPGLQDLIRGSAAQRAGAQDAEPGIMQYMNEQDDPASSPDGTVSDLAAPTVQERIRQRVQTLAGRHDHPALAGINLFDEPRKSMFGRLKFAKTEVRERFPDTRDLPYANVYPSYAARSALGARSYGEYLDSYLKGVRPPLLSFDHYPLLTGDRITDDYFANWAAIRNRALKYRIPSWILIQSVGFEGTIISPARRKPREISELYWQVNVSLAYGAKGIQYFTYWTPRSDPPRIEFTEALVSESGRLTQLYDNAQEVNGYLRIVGRELLSLTSEAVMHAGVKKAKPGVQPFKANNYVRAVKGSSVILGKFRRILENPERYFLVVNRSLDTPTQGTRLTVPASVTGVSRFDTTTDPGTYVPVTLEGTSTRSFPIELDPGRAELYRIEAG
jgi:hypothetical protein